MVVVVVDCLLPGNPADLAVVQVATQQLQAAHRLPRVVAMALQVVQAPTPRVFMLWVLVVVVQAELVSRQYLIRNLALTVVRVGLALSRVRACCMPVAVAVALTAHRVGQTAHPV